MSVSLPAAVAELLRREMAAAAVANGGDAGYRLQERGGDRQTDRQTSSEEVKVLRAFT